MAVELRRTGELFLCSSSSSSPSSSSSSTEFLTQNGVVLVDEHAILDLIDHSEKSKDDCIAELTRQMAAQFMPNQHKPSQPWDFAGSPNTTKVWSPFGSSSGSPEEGPSQETTPPTTPATEKRQSSSIAANMEKMKIEQENPPVKKAPTDIHHQIRAIQLQKLKQDLVLNNKTKNRTDDRIFEGTESKHVQFGTRQRWANHPPSSGMRAVFLEGSGSKTGPPCGTGVFLPGITGDTSHSRKKKGCSPVLIPAKVMQALKFHFDRMDNLSPQNPSPYNFPLQYDNTYHHALKPNGISHSEKNRAVSTVSQNDIGLPQDWTY